MKRFLTLTTLSTLLLVGMGLTARADGYRNPPGTAASLAGAGAGYAWGDGAAALSLNPAGLLDLDQPESMAAATLTRMRTEFKPAAAPGLKLENRDQWVVLPNLYAGGPIGDGDRAWGFGLTMPYGQSVRWRTDDPAPWRYARPYEASMTLLEAAPSFAMRLGERLVLGATLSLYYSELEFKQAVPSAGAIPTLAGPDFDLRFDEDTTAVGGTLGLHWQAVEAVRVALSYKTPVRLRYEGDARIRHLWFGSEMTEGFLASRVRARIDLPDIAALAVGWAMCDRSQVEVGVERLFWSRQDQPSVDVQGPMAPPPRPPSVLG